MWRRATALIIEIPNKRVFLVKKESVHLVSKYWTTAHARKSKLAQTSIFHLLRSAEQPKEGKSWLRDVIALFPRQRGSCNGASLSARDRLHCVTLNTERRFQMRRGKNSPEFSEKARFAKSQHSTSKTDVTALQMVRERDENFLVLQNCGSRAL
ncbi:hypothetical protein CDAR_96921 [Caerostris darwini]|uniref:Uncharacterized protein n=1 Tax=Caerostris darwini TaxID=1538125 RepID=A0AAV4SD40_9ARAC|nr:hypothetical protein CDAR_96921 [Caerostris darwini]